MLCHTSNVAFGKFCDKYEKVTVVSIKRIIALQLGQGETGSLQAFVFAVSLETIPCVIIGSALKY